MPQAHLMRRRHVEVDRVSLPFQVIERVNESRATREAEKTRNPTLFDVWQGDSAETFEEGWRNKLIWGDNKLVMSSLLDQFAGKVDLIYIDPPFATGADFSVTVDIGESGAELYKEQSLIEEKVYRDTWGAGLQSYLQMMYERLQLIRRMLTPEGSFFLHCDWHVGHALKVLCDEVFGADRFINEIAWCYTGPGSPGARQFSRKHDTIFWYSVGEKWTFNADAVRVAHHDKTKSNFKAGLQGSGFVSETYDLAAGGKIPEDYWDLAIAARFPVDGVRRTGYATEKPWLLLDRIILAASNPGDLVADVFGGSGTTAAVAEANGRRWISTDLGRYAVHTTRKRLLGIPGCKPFEVLNLGRYERKYWAVATFGEDIDNDGLISLYEYVAFILKLYGATPAAGMQHLHGKTGRAFVHVGAVDSPVTIDEIVASVDECVALRAKELHILGWEWEMGLHDPISDDAKRRGVHLVLRQIPREVMEQQAAARGDIEFFELAYLHVDIKPKKKRDFTVKLKNFVIPNPDDIGADVDAWSEAYWQDFDADWWREEISQGRLYRSRIDMFLQYWLTMRVKDEIPSDAVFARFRFYAYDYLRQPDSARNFLVGLRRDADTFRDFAQLDPRSARGTFYTRVVEALELGVFIPLLLWLISDAHPISPAQADRALAAVESWAVRRTLLRRTTKDINRLVVALLKELDSKPTEGVGDVTIAFLLAQTADARSWPSDEELMEELPGVKAYGSIKQHRLRTILSAVEMRLRTQRHEEVSLQSRLHIEHVMPQGWRSHWGDDIISDPIATARRDRLVHSIGNLTLVTTALNSTLSNRPWTDTAAAVVAPTGKEAGLGKRSLLDHFSVLLLNKDIVNRHPQEWTEVDIQNRSTALTHLVADIWPVPKTG